MYRLVSPYKINDKTIILSFDNTRSGCPIMLGTKAVGSIGNNQFVFFDEVLKEAIRYKEKSGYSLLDGSPIIKEDNTPAFMYICAQEPFRPLVNPTILQEQLQHLRIYSTQPTPRPTRTDNQHRLFNCSTVMGSAVAAGLLAGIGYLSLKP